VGAGEQPGRTFGAAPPLAASKMALLAYMVMIAVLMTSAFVGYEFIATTSAPRIAVYRAAHERVARQTKLAAASKARIAALQSSESKSPQDPQRQASVTAETEGAVLQDESTNVRRTVRAKPKRALVLRHANEEKTALGYAPSESFNFLGSNRPF
jgi:hypothetical protein